MLEESTFPHVDVFICVYSEPVEIVEPTVIAAVNMNYPGAKLHVHVLDDNKSAPMAAMVSKLQCQMRSVNNASHCVAVQRPLITLPTGDAHACSLKSCTGKWVQQLVLETCARACACSGKAVIPQGLQLC